MEYFLGHSCRESLAGEETTGHHNHVFNFNKQDSKGESAG